MSYQQKRLIPIYTTSGDVGAFLSFPYIFNRSGEWIGWVTDERLVYAVTGYYVGFLSDDPRILRKETADFRKPRLARPPVPDRLNPPATVPLAPMLPELTVGTFDVLDERPELLPAFDFGDLEDDVG